jgi:hypothetical protein
MPPRHEVLNEVAHLKRMSFIEISVTKYLNDQTDRNLEGAPKTA